MPKLNDRERLAELEQRRLKLGEEIEQARLALRTRYASVLSDVAVEAFSERELRDILQHAVRAGAAATITALKTLPPCSG